MKHLTCDEFPSQEKTDELLDKISKYGISSLTIHEREFLDAVSSGNSEVVKDKMSELDGDTFFEDDLFKFELHSVDYDSEDCVKYYGTLYVPDLQRHHKLIKGNLNGCIRLYNNGSYSLDFTKFIDEKSKNIEYDIFEFCSGLEYELDNFIDYLIQELG
jgi:hypothetical protein